MSNASIQKPKAIKRVVIGLGIAAVIASAFIALLLQTSKFLDQGIREYAQEHNITMNINTPPETRFGAIRYQGVTFGLAEKSSIGLLTIYFNPLDLLFKNDLSSIKEINIYNADISGDIDINGNVNIQGIAQTRPTILFPEIEQLKRLEKISIQELQFSFLSAHFGGVRGVLNLQVSRENNNLVWTGNIKSRQNQLELMASLNAQTNKSGRWVSNVDIEDAKLERSFGKITRTHGSIKAQGEKSSVQNLQIQLTAGSLRLFNTSWQNAAITLTKNDTPLHGFIEAKSIGIPGLEISADFETPDMNTHPTWNARIHAQNGEQLVKYMDAHKMQPITKEKTLEQFLDTQNIFLNIAEQNNKRVLFSLQSGDQSIDIKGQIEPVKTGFYKAILTSPKNFTEGLEGLSCQKPPPPRQPKCTMLIQYKNGEYIHIAD